MISMKCNSCGGPLEVSENDFLVSDKIVIQTCQTFRCPYCSSTFQRSEQFKLDVVIDTVQEMNVKSVETMTISKARVAVNTGGGAYIGGNLTLAPGQSFTGRDSKTIIIVQKS